MLENCEAMRKALCLPEKTVPAAMLVFGYPTEDQKTRVKPSRFPKEAVVCENVYSSRANDELRADFKARAEAAGQTNFDYDNYIRAFCERKYESGFSREMNRSAAAYLAAFTGCKDQ